ncbi:MAG: hypothetical protein K6F63_03790, partial [Lachnospiraceae bacterium]|nr:hypothetical protein [Lachnospiraceae bacterium]
LAGLSALKQDFQTALEYADEAVKENCTEPDAYALKTELLRELGRDTSAFIRETYDKKIVSSGVLFRTLERDDFFEAIAEDPEAILALLRFYAENGLFRSAVEVLGICPLDDPLIMYWEGHLHMVLGDMEGAAAIWKDAENTSRGSVFNANCSDIGILKEAVIVGEYVGTDMPVTSYRLGKLLSAAGRGKEAVAEMEKAAAGRPDLAMIAADLSVAYYNQERNAAKALEAIGRACALEPENSLFLLRQDRLLEIVGADPNVRFSLLEGKKELVGERDELCISYARLLNLNGRHEEALKALEDHDFKAWMGNSGKAAEEYRNTLRALAVKEMVKGNTDRAIELCKDVFACSEKPVWASDPDSADSKTWFMLGELYREKGDAEASEDAYLRAARVEERHADIDSELPSESIYWAGLAKARLGQSREALAIMKDLIDLGNAHMNDVFEKAAPAGTDGYEEDPKILNEDRCKRLVNLGVKGLTEVG